MMTALFPPSIAIALIVGFYLGKYITNHFWSSNADRIQRIYYAGRLYKVRYDDKGGKDGENL